MKCTNCGLPLSPNNTPANCPRCHTTLLSEAKMTIGRALQPPLYPAPTQHNQLPFPQAAQIPFPQPGQLWYATPTSTPTPPPTPAAIPIPSTPGMFETIGNNSSPSFTPLRTTDNMYASANPFGQSRPTRTKKSNLGFIVATVFVTTGGLLLILVYILALGLPQNNTTSALVGTPQATRNILPSPTTTSTPTALPTSTTSAFPGQQYIDNPQMASSVNINTAQPLQPTTTFRVNKRIYVTFAIHPNGKNGAVCLYWYLNNHAVTQYPFSVTAAARAGYSYAIYGGRGNGYVDIYWASTIACSDKMLAQQVNFTVTA